jgi:hypothetical protein
MPAVTRQYPLEELERRAAVIYEARVKPELRPEDDYKFVAIDVTSGDFEIDPDDYAAIKRLRDRHGDAQAWLMRVGQPAAYRIRWRQ